MTQAQLFQDKEKPTAENVRRVLVPYPVDKAYDYILPPGMEAQPGDYVCVPLGGREVPGVVWGEASGEVKPAKLKEAVSIYNVRPLLDVHRKFIDWTSRYTMTPPGAVLKMTLSVPAGLEPEKPVLLYTLVPPPPQPSPRRGEGVAKRREGGQNYAPKPAKQTIKNSQALRKNLTEIEKKLWFTINRRQLGAKFRRQHPVGPYITDFACLERSLIIELDGGQHDERQDYDEERTAYLESQGFRVLRFWNNEVNENLDGVLDRIKSEIEPVPAYFSLSPKQQAVADVLADGIPRRPSEIAEAAGCTPGVVTGMAKKGLLQTVEQTPLPPCVNPDPHRAGPALSEDQRAVAERLAQLDPAKPILLDGVTGAGKTEVYFEAVAEALKQDKQILILLPEIALSNAFLERFKARFGCAPALWHSNLTPAQRRRTWRGVAMGESKVVVGARSALFLPYADLGLIIVDEEHDPAYKQEDNVIYHARDMAIVRAHLGRIPVVLVSATPSLETIHNAWQGRYEHLHLPDRFGGARLPDVHLIDMREDKPERGDFIAPSLKVAMVETLQRGEQVMLFLNRRGYAPLTLCRTCGHRLECPRCTAWLVEHKSRGKLQCHHCGFAMQTPRECPSCEDTDSLAACGPGVERIREEAGKLFPDARIMVLASDTAESNEQLRKMLDQIRSGEIDIVIGTQIIAKGHHFPGLTCVGVIDADLGLQGGELRAAERTYQLLHQVAGRAGRAEKKGHVYLQSFMPDHTIMQALAHTSDTPPPVPSGLPPPGGGQASGRDLFLEAEALEREAARMPPYTRLAGIIVSGREESQVVEVAKELGRTAPQGPEIQTLGPAPAPLARLRGKYRYRLLVRADKKVDIQKTVGSWVAGVKPPSTVRVYIDIDPQSFL